MCVCVCVCVCLFRCEELVEVYLRDPSPETRLLVGGDLRKIQLCFTLLKVYIHTLTAHTLTHHTMFVTGKGALCKRHHTH